MQTKQKPLETHICTERPIEIRTDTKRQKHMPTQKCKNETFIYFQYRNGKQRQPKLSFSVTEVLLKNVTQPIPIVLIATHIFLLFEVATGI